MMCGVKALRDCLHHVYTVVRLRRSTFSVGTLRTNRQSPVYKGVVGTLHGTKLKI